MKHTLLAAVIAGLAGSAAIAGSPEPYVEHVYMPPIEVDTGADWEGFYAGLTVGVQNGDWDNEPAGPPLFEVETLNYGGFAGYNFQSGDFVYGLEVAAQMGSATIQTLPGDRDINYLVDARARIGYSFGDVLAYAAGGYTAAQVNLPAPIGDTNMSGFNVGAGIDLAVTDKFFVGGEYVYRDLSGTFTPPATDFTANTHGFQARVGYRF